MLTVVHETIPSKPRVSLFCHDQDLPDFNCPYHRHPEIEIVRIDESEGQVMIGDGSDRFGVGDVFVMAGNLPHAFYNDESTTRARSRCLQFNPGPLKPAGEAWPELEPLATLEQKAGRGLRLRGEDAARGSAFLDQIFELSGIEQIAALFQLLSFVIGLESPQSLASHSYAASLNDKGLFRLDRVLQFIHANVTETVSVEQLAQVAGMSVSAFHRLFQQRLGRSPLAYLLDLRFSMVAHLLIETGESVTHIAYAAGFNNLSNFNRQFRERFGCSPRDYRNRTLAEAF